MILNEKLGVPKGLDNQASKIFNELINDIKSYSGSPGDLPSKFDYKDGEYSIVIGEYDIEIGELKLKNIPFYLRLYYIEDIPKAELVAASYGNKVGFSDKKGDIKIKQNYKDSFFLIKVAVGKNSTKSELIESIHKSLNTSIIAHELMHLYDNYKKLKTSIEDTVDYKSYQRGGFPEIISSFLYLLYYMTSVENAVRPAELYQSLLDNNISKSDFKEFVEKTKIMKNVRRAENFSLSKFKDQLKDDKEIKEMVKQAIDSGYQSIGSVSDDALNLLMINLMDEALTTSSQILKSYVSENSPNLFFMFLSQIDSEELKNIEKRAEKKFNQILSKYSKYEKNPQKYFEYLEKRLNFVGNKMKRKLYKLYDMVKDTTNKSIINWDLHNKINSRNEKMVYTLDFKSFKRK